MLEIKNTVKDMPNALKGVIGGQTQLRKESESWDTHIGTSQTEMQGERKK